MTLSHNPNRMKIAFDDNNLISDAGLILPAVLAEKLNLRKLFDTCVDLGDAPGRANVGIKALSLIHSLLCGGDCIDDVDKLRAGYTQAVLGQATRSSSTVGTFLRSFTWGHVKQLDMVGFKALKKAWANDAHLTSSDPFIVDIDSTICQTYGLAKQGASGFTYMNTRGYHPLIAVAAGIGDILHVRLRKGAANTCRGASSFVVETINRIRSAGVKGQVILRADGGFYSHKVVNACRKKDVRFSITAKMSRSLHKAVEQIPQDEWKPIPYFMQGAAVAEIPYTPFGKKGFPLRLIVRRVPPSPDSQLSLFVDYSYHALITDRDGDILKVEAEHRRHAEVESAIKDLKYNLGLNHMPSGKFAANAAWLALNAMAYNLSRWVSRLGFGEKAVSTKTLRRRALCLAGRIARSGRKILLHLPKNWPWANEFKQALKRLQSMPPPLAA